MIPFNRFSGSDMSEDLLKICAMALVCVIAAVILRGASDKMGALVSIFGGVAILSLAVLLMSELVGDVSAIIDKLEMSSEITRYWKIMLRALGIAVLCRICSDTCRDCGEGTVAGGVEIAGKVAILSLSLPMIEEILEYAQEILSKA